MELAGEVYSYYRRVGDDRAAAIVGLLHVEHLYYKHDTVAAAVQRAHLFHSKWGNHSDLHPASTGRIIGVPKRDQRVTHPASFLGNPTVVTPPSNASSLQLDSLCQFIFKAGDERTKTRALLCSVYHHALHDRYYQARDLFLMSHIQDSIDKVDPKTQILYNRALVTLGLSAFRQGLIAKAYDCLVGVCSARMKELLAQGQARWHDKDADQEKLERRRQIPYHMHINPDLLECCYVLCCMFLELPGLSGSSQQNSVSKSFRKYLQAYNRQVFTGPPENIREHIMAAAKCLLVGEWTRASSLILDLEVWNLIPGDGGAKLKEMLREKLKELAVRTYLIAYGANYESLCLTHLNQMFDLTDSASRRIVSRMIFHREISAAWDFDAKIGSILVLNTAEAVPMTHSLMDKVAALVESNERMLDPLVGVYNFKEEWSGGRTVDSSRKQTWTNDQQGERKKANWKSSKPILMRANFNRSSSSLGRVSGVGRGGSSSGANRSAGASSWNRPVAPRPQLAPQDPSNKHQQQVAAAAADQVTPALVRKNGWNVV